MALELPSTNSYWKGTLVTNWINRFSLQTTFFNGCMYGLTAPFGPAAGQLMLKSWKVATDLQPLQEELSLRCIHTEPHTATSGKNASASENYPPEMARAVHRAFATHATTDTATTTAGKMAATRRK